MGDHSLSDAQVQKLVQDVQSVNQTAQELKQTLSNAGVLQKDLASGAANVGYEKFTEDPGVDEANKIATYSTTRVWNLNDKRQAARELDYDRALQAIELEKARLELKQQQHDFAHKQKLDHIEIIASRTLYPCGPRCKGDVD